MRGWWLSGELGKLAFVTFMFLTATCQAQTKCEDRCILDPDKPELVQELGKPESVSEVSYPKWIYWGQIPLEMLESPDYPYATLINQAAMEANVDPLWMYRVAAIESGHNPRNRTGSYKGLFQLSDYEFTRHGGGNIYDSHDNAYAAARMFAEQRAQFLELFGRYPDGGESYMIHQQGIEGCAAHIGNPDKLAWENMRSTGEGRQKGEWWARLAIWGNLPPQAHARYGSVDNVTSRDFVKLWSDRVSTGNWPMSW